jgi:hypothetical protein
VLVVYVIAVLAFCICRRGPSSTNNTIVGRALESISRALVLLVLVLLVTSKALIKPLSVNRD